MSDTLYVDSTIYIAPIEKAESDPHYIKHVICESARFHVIHWDSNGSHCSEKDCILNKKVGEQNDRTREIYPLEGKG